MESPRVRYDGKFTFALFAAGFLALFPLHLYTNQARVLRDGGAVHAADAWGLFQAVMVLFLLSGVVPGILRLGGFRAGHAATRAALGILAFWFPPGTALLVWWLLFLKDREASALDRAVRGDPAGPS